MSSGFILCYWINSFSLCKNSTRCWCTQPLSVLEAVWVGFTVHYHGGEVWVIWFCWAESCCMWIFEALGNPVPDCFSSGHRTGVKAVMSLLLRPNHQHTRAQSRCLECTSLDDTWTSLAFGSVGGKCAFLWDIPFATVDHHCLCCALYAAGDEPQLIHKYEGRTRGLRSGDTRLWVMGSQHSSVRWDYMHIFTVGNLARLCLKSQPFIFCGRSPHYFIKVKNKLRVSSSAVFIQVICIPRNVSRRCWDLLAENDTLP